MKNFNYSIETYNEVLMLRKKGMTFQEISKNLNVPYYIVYSWCKGSKPLRFSEKHRKQRIKAIKAVNKRNKRLREEKYKKLKQEVTPEFAFVLGSILGDGAVVIRKRDCRTMAQTCLITKDKDYAEAFKACLEKWSGERCKLVFYVSTWQPWCYSLTVAKILKEFEWNKILEHSEEIRGPFLRGLFDSEGSVDFKSKRISFTNTNVELINLVKRLLSTFKIESRIMNVIRKERFIEGRKLPVGIVYYVRISGKKNLELFYNKIGFAISRKQRLLEQILSSYVRAHPVKWSQHEVKFLKNNIDMKPRMIAQKLGRTPKQVRRKRYNLKRSLV